MKGWTADGTEIELTAKQEHAVRAILDWDRGYLVILPGWGKGSGKTVVMITVGRYIQARADGLMLEDDPARRSGASGGA